MRIPAAYFLILFMTAFARGQEHPLFAAARSGDMSALRAFAADKANVNRTGPHQRTALHEAAASCQMDAVLFLLDAGWSDAAKDEQGLQPIAYAKDCPNFSPAVLRSFMKSHLAESNVDAANKTSVDRRPSEGSRMSIHYAVAHGNMDVVSMLLRLGLNANEVSREGNSPLYLAGLKGNSAITSLLLDKGADPAQADSMGFTALHAAAMSGNTETVLLLTKRGGNVNAIDSEDGATPLHLAASLGHLGVVKVLVDAGADRALKNKSGKTARQLAADHGHVEVGQYLSSDVPGKP